MAGKKKVIWKLDLTDPNFEETVIARMGLRAGSCFVQLLLALEILQHPQSSQK
jgi:hypothetical protein